MNGGVAALIDQPRLAEFIAQAVVRAAMATGELSLLSYRDEQALKGHVAFKARWVAFAALVSTYPHLRPQLFAQALGCGPRAETALSFTRRTSWWDEGVVVRLVVDLAGAPDRRPLVGLEGLVRTVADLVDGIINTGIGEVGR
ncbi:MAG: hypothetical protein JSS35_14395 [Proteobacteria bacterium]|nr:hypothetical protein [Pseudomonadota bacterium]